MVHRSQVHKGKLSIAPRVVTRVTVGLPPGVMKRLEDQAEAEGVKVARLARRLLIEAIQKN